MSEQIPITKGKRTKRNKLPYLGEDVLFKIFVKCHPKTVRRLRMLSHHWNDRLRGYNSYNDKTHWVVAVDAEDDIVSNIQFPVQLEDYGYFSIIDSDRGNLCINYSKTWEEVKLMVWNPLTKVVAEVDDQSYKYWGFNVSIYAFGYLKDGWQYRVVYLFKKIYTDRKFNWLMWNSLKRYWSHEGEFESDIHKIGPTSVVIKGDEIPEENISQFHSIAKLNKGHAFVAYNDVRFKSQLDVWSIECTEDRKFLWQKLYNIQDFGIPYTPSILHKDEVISVLDTRSTMARSNDDRRTEVVISKINQNGGGKNIIYHNGWQMSVFLKSTTMHCDGLFEVRRGFAKQLKAPSPSISSPDRHPQRKPETKMFSKEFFIAFGNELHDQIYLIDTMDNCLVVSICKVDTAMWLPCESLHQVRKFYNKGYATSLGLVYVSEGLFFAAARGHHKFNLERMHRKKYVREVLPHTN
ncbi:hypothetical protein PIB30_006525 [Stylosanthes scabra]|uniref:F-box domain-containing protein n=1 Tax=Stylosanthes scabra TaxID=79078 RepID=A0ABU6W3P8_9FABA|nr:hypothetical protein [Stylosanthes scabra]